MIIKSFAKINLSLDVLNKRNDGYHNIDTIMAYIDLYDTIKIQENNLEKLILSSNNIHFPTDSSNLIYKVWMKMKELTGKNTGYFVHVEKNIPIAAGLAGGTSNACSFMQFLIEKWSVKLKPKELKKLCESLGADFYFFFQNNMVRATGIGTDFETIHTTINPFLLIVNNGEHISTKYVYDHINLSKQSTIKRCVDVIEKNERDLFKATFYNTMQEVVNRKTDIQIIIDKMLEMNSTVALMSGSGPTIFGFYEKKEDLDKAYNYFLDKYPYVYKSKLR